MRGDQFWKNFNLGEELSISGSFIYDGLRRFHEMRSLNYTDEIFEFFYHLSVGIERLLKIAIVLIEHKEESDHKLLEDSLRTHTHQELFLRVRTGVGTELPSLHNDFLDILGTFYNKYRYDRFNLGSIYDTEKEREILYQFIGRHLKVDFEDRTNLLGIPNEDRYRQFIRRTVIKISTTLYEVIKDQASKQNLFTYELRNGSKAETVFLEEANLSDEEVLWKELLIFFMNTDLSSGYLNFMRGIPPLDFDPALASDYIECFRSDAAKASVIGELKELYSEVENPKMRLKMLSVIGGQNILFDDDFEDEGSE